jgi:hypothetical protein
MLSVTLAHGLLFGMKKLCNQMAKVNDEIHGEVVCNKGAISSAIQLSATFDDQAEVISSFRQAYEGQIFLTVFIFSNKSTEILNDGLIVAFLIVIQAF